MGLEHVLDAASVAVVGASKKETKRGYQAIKTLIEEKFEGQVYPVNPKEESILGLPCYPKVSDIEDPVEMVLITTPATTIPEILEDCGKKGVAGAVIIAGGFGELGKEGEETGRPDRGYSKEKQYPGHRAKHLRHDESQEKSKPGWFKGCPQRPNSPALPER